MIELEHGIKNLGPINTRATTPDWGTFTQNLDHFNRFDNRTWQMVSDITQITATIVKHF